MAARALVQFWLVQKCFGFNSDVIRVFGSKFGSTQFDSVKPNQLSQRSQSVKPESTRVNNGQSGQRPVNTKDPEGYSCTLASHVIGTKSWKTP
ncbi:hypothetical protein Hdeb2414_s0004g00134311 [Helianthus debilis subsp. tardiflorus]